MTVRMKTTLLKKQKGKQKIQKTNHGGRWCERTGLLKG